MARIQPVPPEKASWLLKLANRYARKKVGQPLEPSAIMAHNGWVLAANGAYELAIARANRVPERLKALASLKAAAMIGCPF